MSSQPQKPKKNKPETEKNEKKTPKPKCKICKHNHLILGVFGFLISGISILTILFFVFNVWEDWGKFKKQQDYVERMSVEYNFIYSKYIALTAGETKDLLEGFLDKPTGANGGNK